MKRDFFEIQLEAYLAVLRKAIKEVEDADKTDESLWVLRNKVSKIEDHAFGLKRIIAQREDAEIDER